MTGRGKNTKREHQTGNFKSSSDSACPRAERELFQKLARGIEIGVRRQVPCLSLQVFKYRAEVKKKPFSTCLFFFVPSQLSKWSF